MLPTARLRIDFLLWVAALALGACRNEVPEGYYDRCASSVDCVSPFVCLEYGSRRVCSMACQVDSGTDGDNDWDDCPVLPSICGEAAPCVEGICGPSVDCDNG